MREKILKVINATNKNLNAMEIMNSIKQNSTVEELRSLIHELDLMCRDGILRTSSGNTYKKNDLLTTTLDVHEKGNAHAIVKGGNDIFIARNNMKGASDKDTVLVDILDPVKGEGKVVKVLKRSLGRALAEVVVTNGIINIVPLDEDLPYKITVEESNFNLVDGLIVHLDYVHDISKGNVLTRIDSIIGHKNAPGKDTEIAMIASEFGLRLDFPEEVKKEAEAMPKKLSEEMIDEGIEQGRVDFRGDTVFTIDGKDTKDIDDAISMKMLPNGNYELCVHIADVSHYVKPGSAIWKEAELRGNSNYLGNKVLPMLPIELSNGICSLNPNEDRFTETCIMEINHSGEVVNKKVVKGIIKSKKKMNYDAVQDILENKNTEDTKDYTTLKYTVKSGEDLKSIAFNNNMTVEELQKYNEGIEIKPGIEIDIPCDKIIKNMHVLSKILKANKSRRGELEFLSDEVKIVMDEEDKVVDVIAREQRDAEKLIEDFMIVANESVATILFEEEIPTSYRDHEVPSPKKMEDYMKFLSLIGISYDGSINIEKVTPKECQKLLEYLKDKENFKILNKKLLRSMQKAMYSPENKGHFGIASKCYTHFTSPIRRMSDLLVHTAITNFLLNEELDNKFLDSWHAYLTTVCEYISECERNSEKCEYAVDDALKAEYMMSRIGEEFEATIDSIMPNSFFVQTDNYIDGRVDVIVSGEKLIPVSGYYDYNENLMGYTRNNKVELRYGDRICVKCINADKVRREVDFALVRKL
jgi:ribonuclease R